MVVIDPAQPEITGLRPPGGASMAIFALMLVVILPSVLRFFVDVSSMMPGLLLACAVIIGAGILGYYRISGGRYWVFTLVSVGVIVLLVIVQGMIASLMVDVDLARAAGSLLGLAVMVLSAYPMRLILQQTSSEMIDRIMLGASCAFVLIAVFSIAGLQPLDTEYGKPIFPFTEPSHFALSFTPFLIYQSVRSSLLARIAWLAIALVLAVLLQSLSMVVAIGVAAACSLSIPLLSVMLIVLSVAIGYVDTSYFTDRLDFSINTTNVSTLVYIQGLELMDAAIRLTSGWGIGFQQLGIVPLNVPTSDLIYRLIRDDANLRDGGFTAAKLIAEMGFIGVVLIAVYVFLLARAGLALRALAGGRAGTAHELFALAAIAAPSIELFVRGTGYFSGTLLLMGAALLMAMEGGYLARRRPIAGDSRT